MLANHSSGLLLVTHSCDVLTMHPKGGPPVPPVPGGHCKTCCRLERVNGIGSGDSAKGHGSCLRWPLRPDLREHPGDPGGVGGVCVGCASSIEVSFFLMLRRPGYYHMGQSHLVIRRTQPGHNMTSIGYCVEVPHGA